MIGVQRLVLLLLTFLAEILSAAIRLTILLNNTLRIKWNAFADCLVLFLFG